MAADTEQFETTMSEHAQPGVVSAVRRGVSGVFDGAQTGAVIGLGMAGAALLADAALGTNLSSMLHLSSSPVTGTLALAAVHSTGAAAFEGLTEAYDGFRGVKDADHIRHTAEALDRPLLERGENTLHLTPVREPMLEAPQPQHTAVESAVHHHPHSAAAATQWRDRIAAERAMLAQQERSV